MQIYDFFLIYTLSHNYFLILQAALTMRRTLLGIFIPFFLTSIGLSAQTVLDRPVSVEFPVPAGRPSPEQLIARGDSLHLTYHFQDAINHYLAVATAPLGADERASLDRRIAASQNGLNMTDFCADPHVVARQRFSRKDFFLFYPLTPQSWHSSPNPLDSLDGYPLYHPKGERTIYYTAPDRAGTRSIFITDNLDSLWGAPRLAGESVTSTGSEIFPMLSPDGKTLYFASDGLFGMGGFDLYASAWDEAAQAWGEPVNLGFPFSSPGDDFLLMDTPDGKYTLFASNRDCSRDSVYVYVLEYQASRERHPVRDYGDLRRIASLRPVEDLARIDNASAVSHGAQDNANTRLYLRKNEEARALRDSIYRQQKMVDALRLSLSEAREDETAALTARIRDGEKAMEPLRKLLEETELEIRLVEQSFLSSGVVASSGNEEREVVGSALGYTFAKNAMGPRLRLKVGRHPVRSTFRIAPVGRFATDNTLPPGLVYQIQLFTSPRHASVEDLAGLSPVYERLASNLRYTYSVGLYPSYVSALLDLNVVRRLGFPDARITAYRDARPIPVSTARQEE